MWIGQPPGEFLYQRGWSYDHQIKSCYWNQSPVPWRPTHVSDFSLCVVQRLTPPFFFFFFLFLAVFAWKRVKKARGKRDWCSFFRYESRKKEENVRPVYGKKIPFFSFLISVASLDLMVVGPSPLARKQPKGLPNVHSFHLWFHALVRELRKKLEIFFRSQRVI